MVLINKVQNQLEKIYGIKLDQRACEYLINQEEARNYLKVPTQHKIPKELFFVRKPEEDTVEIALFLDVNLIKNLQENDPYQALNHKNLSDFCILIEGISHFVYFLWKAGQNKSITQLEMELQAEIDKFIMLFFYLQSDHTPQAVWQLFESLFENFKLFENLSKESKERYVTASHLASRFCYNFKKHHEATKKIDSLVDELRQFYNFSQQEKIQYIMP